MTDDLTDAAVARLREAARCRDTDLLWGIDPAVILAALEAAQVEARRGKAMADALRENYYCECCDKAPAKPVQFALAAIDARAKVKP